jgi:hypothetical protein
MSNGAFGGFIDRLLAALAPHADGAPVLPEPGPGS